MPVAYGCIFVTPLARRARRARRRCDRDQCDAWGGVMRGGVCRRVKMWNFSVARRGAFACKCVSAAGSELTVARRRRKESLPPLAMLQTRSAASRGPKPVGPALCWKHVQATGGHAVRFLKLSSPLLRRASLTHHRWVILAQAQRGPPKHSLAPVGLPAARSRAAKGPGVSGSIRRRILEPKHVPLVLQPARPPKVLARKTHKDANTTRRRTRDRTQRTATHHATDAPSRAAAAEHNKGSPLPIKIEGSLA